jgi:hypothetical protein
MLDFYRGEIKSKKFSKTDMEKLLSYLMKNLTDTNERQKNLEKKVESLTIQNEGFIIQNQQIIQEVINKNDYTKKLETLLFFILEVILPKQPFKTATTTSVNNINCGLVSSNPDFKNKTSNDPRNNVYKNAFENLGENFIMNLLEKYMDKNGPKIENKIFSKIDLPIYTHRSNNQLGCAEDTNNNQPMKFEDDNHMNRYRQQHNNGSPNPFSDEYCFKSGLFGSPNVSNFRADPVDSLGFNLYKTPSEGNMNNNNNIMSSSNNILNHRSRTNSFDLDIFKSESFEDHSQIKQDIEHPHVFDESYFSVSSDKK